MLLSCPAAKKVTSSRIATQKICLNSVSINYILSYTRIAPLGPETVKSRTSGHQTDSLVQTIISDPMQKYEINTKKQYLWTVL